MLYSILFILAIVVEFYLTFKLLKEIWDECRYYSKYANKAEVRKQMANDPNRFHSTIVYLMGCMMRSEQAVKVKKLEFIIHYINEVCPKECYPDVLTTLKYITDREKTIGKNTKQESLIWYKDASCESRIIINMDCCSSDYYYEHELHGARLAEELGRYLSQDDKKYVMFILFQVAIANDKSIRTKAKYSELQILYDLCIKGLKLDKSELNNLIDHFEKRQTEQWYKENFSDKAGSYPSYGKWGDIFYHDKYFIPDLPQENIKKTSDSAASKWVLWVSSIFLFIMGLLYFKYSCEPIMSDHFDMGLFFLLANMIIPILISFIKPFDSSKIAVVRTKIEDWIQLKYIIFRTILSFAIIILMHIYISSIFFIAGNNTFCGQKDYEFVRAVRETYQNNNNKKTTYHVRFKSVVFKAKKYKCDNDDIFFLNRLCLNIVKGLPYIRLSDIKNDYKKQRAKVSYIEYSNAYKNKIILHFRVGYFGIMYYTGHKIIASTYPETPYQDLYPEISND